MIPDWKIWATILGLAAATYLIRFSFLGLVGGREVPPWLRRALGFVPAAVLPALVAPMVFVADGAWTLNPALVASAGGALAAGILTRNVLAGILGGLAGFALGGLHG